MLREVKRRKVLGQGPAIGRGTALIGCFLCVTLGNGIPLYYFIHIILYKLYYILYYYYIIFYYIISYI